MRLRISLAVSLFVALTLVGSAHQARAQGPDGWEQQLVEMINQRRAQAGLYPFQVDERLMQSARQHASDMASHRFCRHGGSDGSSSRARISAHGVPSVRGGENILCRAASPEAAMGWWMNSGPHRRNLLHGFYTHIGVAYVPVSGWRGYWTINFARPTDRQ